MDRFGSRLNEKTRQGEGMERLVTLSDPFPFKFGFFINAFFVSYNSQRYDRVFALLDARVPTKVTKHSLQADPECLLWNPHNPAQV